MRRHLTPLSMTFLFAMLVVMPLHALMQSGECPDIIERALTDVGDNCQDLPKNSACYGFNRVEATFGQEAPDDFFSEPSDTAEIVSLQAIATAPLDEALGQWGVAVLSVQANVPNSLPGQSVRFLLFGEVAVENAVPADEALVDVEPIPITTLVGANIRTRPIQTSNVVGSVTPGTPLLADGVSEDGGWLRVVFGETTPGWISAQLVDAEADLSTLPTLSDDSRSPMQTFYFRTGIGQPACDEAPDVLVVQGPDNIRVNITANGADIQIGSTIILKSIGDDQVQLATLSGEARVDGVRVPEGFAVTATLNEDGLAGNFGNLHPLTLTELDDLRWLENTPESLLEYPIDVPDRPGVFAPIVTNPQQPATNTIVAPTTSDGSVDCSSFRATSPLDGAFYGRNTFYWDPAPGATGYRLNVPGVGSVEVPATSTSVTYNIASAGGAFEISWSVDALLNGVVVCSSQYVTIPRESAPPPLTASWSCSGDDRFTIRYDSLPPQDDSIAFVFSNFTDGSISPDSGYTISGAPVSGSQTFVSSEGFVDVRNGQVISYPSGTTVNLSPDTLTCFPPST